MLMDESNPSVVSYNEVLINYVNYQSNVLHFSRNRLW